MAYASLTAEQKGILNEYVRLLRALAGEQARVNNHAQALNEDYAQVQTILGLLQSGDVISDGSGLAGSASLTAAEVTSLTATFQGLLAAYNQLGQRQLWAKAAGPGNLIG
jgi:hypothetical protein